MSYPKKIIQSSDKESLVEMVLDLQSKLKDKNAELLRVRTKLNSAKSRVIKLKDTVEYQRQRILELYPSVINPSDIR
jgi:predicted nuclease with TOPRIM domain